MVGSLHSTTPPQGWGIDPNLYEEQSQRLQPGEDDGLLEALEYGMPPTCGVGIGIGIGIGIDRFEMWLTGATNIRDVQMFPLSRHATDSMRQNQVLLCLEEVLSNYPQKA